MSKYIDADLLRKEIERRFWDYGTPLHDEEVTKKVDEILDLLDTLPEQPAENLDAEIDRFYCSDEYKMSHELGRGFEAIAYHFLTLDAAEPLKCTMT